MMSGRMESSSRDCGVMGERDVVSDARSKRRVRRDDVEAQIDFTFGHLSLSRINGEINKMKKNDMVTLLKQKGLRTKGVKEVLNRRLKNYYKKQQLEKAENDSGQQYYQHFIVIDFEATCKEGKDPEYLHEIIEFPAILVEAETGRIIDEFHSYCRPTHNSKLTDFCSSLTGISQSDVDEAPCFNHVFNSFETWMKERNLLLRRSCAFISDGPWDFSRFLNIQCCLSDIQYPKWARKWINLKKAYGNHYKVHKPKIEEMLSKLGLRFEGRLHCGLDDARNMCRIVSRLVEDGCVLQPNERLNAGRIEMISEAERKKAICGLSVNSSNSDRVGKASKTLCDGLSSIDGYSQKGINCKTDLTEDDSEIELLTKEMKNL